MGHAGEVGCWYFEATPDREYEVDLVDREGRVIATSNRVRTPRDGPASEVDEALTEGELEVLAKLAGAMIPAPVAAGRGGPSHS
jgi:hypothetical protein